jgi:trans-aconitate 2-methyltransferase
MIELAKDLLQLNWKLMDTGKDDINEKYDIVFSNAAIQRIPNQAELLLKFSKIMTEIGILAIQMAQFMGISKSNQTKVLTKNPTGIS